MVIVRVFVLILLHILSIVHFYSVLLPVLPLNKVIDALKQNDLLFLYFFCRSIYDGNCISSEYFIVSINCQFSYWEMLDYPIPECIKERHLLIGTVCNFLPGIVVFVI